VWVNWVAVIWNCANFLFALIFAWTLSKCVWQRDVKLLLLPKITVHHSRGIFLAIEPRVNIVLKAVWVACGSFTLLALFSTTEAICLGYICWRSRSEFICLNCFPLDFCLFFVVKVLSCSKLILFQQFLRVTDLCKVLPRSSFQLHCV
jgi:hypothetical protein